MSAFTIKLDRCRAGRDQGGINPVVLRQLQVKLGIGSHLRRLEHDHDEPLAAQPGDDRLLIAATRLDADPSDPALP
jgi:hypothetical protein